MHIFDSRVAHEYQANLNTKCSGLSGRSFSVNPELKIFAHFRNLEQHEAKQGVTQSVHGLVRTTKAALGRMAMHGCDFSHLPL